MHEMKNRIIRLLGLSLTFFCAWTVSVCASGPGTASRKNALGKISVQWEDARLLAPGGYARVHRLDDGRYMAVYSRGGDGCLKFSSDGCETWTGQRAVMRHGSYDAPVKVTVSNAEFAQLSASNPHHPGRIIYAANIRPAENKSSQTPYTIAISTSDDAGATWTGIRDVYRSKVWDKDVLRGCYEPCVLELPDGTVQIYFADETPYYERRLPYQNISVIESKDGGDTWGPARIVCYNEKFRDGMPVAMIHGDWIYVAIEANGQNIKFHPQIVCTRISDNWKTPVYGSSEYRFDPFRTSMESAFIYAGAPYIIKTDNYFVICYQSSEGAVEPTTKNSVMEMAICRIDEMRGHEFLTMREQIRPFDIDQTRDNGLWNSLCDLGNDTILAVTQLSGNIYIRKGKIVTKQ